MTRASRLASARDDEPVRAPATSLLAVVAAVSVMAIASVAGCTDDGDAGAPAGGSDGPPTGGITATTSRETDRGTHAGTDAGAGTAGTTAPPRPTVPEVGVPGLDSTDAVCRSWSRFGGSFQVVAVAASFGGGGPLAATELEVAAAPTVTSAYDDLLDAWPDELAAERTVVADDYLGPFARRARRGVDALVAAGASPSDLQAIAAAWEAALAARDPSTPELELVLDEPLGAMVVAAAAGLAGELAPVPEDPELVVTADTPATDAYLEANCPDQGTLSGESTG
jgi:hypothetical protein